MTCLADRVGRYRTDLVVQHACHHPGNSGVFTEEQCIAALKKIGGRPKRESGLIEEDVKMGKNMRATNRVLTTMAKLLPFLDESMLRNGLEANGTGQESAGRVIARIVVRGMQPTSFLFQSPGPTAFEGRIIRALSKCKQLSWISDKRQTLRKGNVVGFRVCQRIVGDRNQHEDRRSGNTRGHAQSRSRGTVSIAMSLAIGRPNSRVSPE